jgi:hypothetical protein
MHNALYKAPQKIPHNSITLQIYNNFTQITNFSRGKTFYVWFWTGRFWTGLRFCGWGNVPPLTHRETSPHPQNLRRKGYSCHSRAICSPRKHSRAICSPRKHSRAISSPSRDVPPVRPQILYTMEYTHEIILLNTST